MYTKNLALAITIGFAGMLGAGAAFAQDSGSAGPSRAEIEQYAMAHGPSTSRIGYLTYHSPRPARSAAAPVDPRMLQPLTAREAGMLFHACSAYMQCRTEYPGAQRHYDALVRAGLVRDGGWW